MVILKLKYVKYMHTYTNIAIVISTKYIHIGIYMYITNPLTLTLITFIVHKWI